jgi:glycosyltransferase involved in cell wall biosynthesis
MKPAGGTEILRDNLLKRINLSLSTNLIISDARKALIDPTKRNILWQHLNTNENAVSELKETKDQYDLIVFVSEWQRTKFIQEFGVSPSKSIVIKNAIEPIRIVPKQTKPIKLIYTSTPWRGLEVLMKLYPRILGDISLSVYSSTIIYGNHFSKSIGDQFNYLYNICRTTPRCDYKGYALNQAVRFALTNHNILAYPSVFEETSCLAAIEAGAAGCEIVTTNFGALKETCGPYAKYVEVNQNLVESYEKVLQKTIDEYDPNRAKEISNYFNDNYSWDVRIKQWREIL